MRQKESARRSKRFHCGGASAIRFFMVVTAVVVLATPAAAKQKESVCPVGSAVVGIDEVGDVYCEPLPRPPLGDKVIAAGYVRPDGLLYYDATGNFQVVKSTSQDGTYDIHVREPLACDIHTEIVGPETRYYAVPRGLILATPNFAYQTLNAHRQSLRVEDETVCPGDPHRFTVFMADATEGNREDGGFSFQIIADRLVVHPN